ncbi:hypothetical protein [Endozoicomonas euniceicola]|uniref:Uncharacterized protein n=1 Tax=Endozoicomonas euniceicola TaxID=1234143 RepID=A0ABY6H3A3_9GAMM|nr:hypothetical protein [Endozoicomonas euniceicola]UYM18736.1 hypothetical protein NX720_12795 [Endozoicomonas euniceicola]
MIPSTTATGVGSTGPFIQAATAASPYGSVVSHSGTNLLQGQECLPLWRTLLQRPVLQLPLKKIENGSLIKKLPVDDQHQLMKEICQIQSDTARLVHEETEALWSEKNKQLTARINLLNSEMAARKVEYEKLKKANEKSKCQLERSKVKDIKAKANIQNMQQEIRDQKKSLKKNFKDMAKFKTDIASAIGRPVASATKYGEAISLEDLIKELKFREL